MTTTAPPVVLIAEELAPSVLEVLGRDVEIRHVDGADRAALLPALADAAAVMIRSATQIDAEALAAAPNLKVVARAGIGLDNVDVAAATERGVMVVNAPTSNITSAAELAVGLMLAAARHIAPASASASIFVAERTRTASASGSADSSSARSAPLQCRISKSGPSASRVAGLSSSAMSTTGLLT